MIGCLALASLSLFTGRIAAQPQVSQWKAFVNTGWRLCREGDASAAKDYLLKALQQADGFPADDPRRTLTLSYLAFASLKQGQRAESDRYVGQALAMYDRQPAGGVPHPTVGKGLNALALTAQRRNDFDQADQLYQRAIAAEEKSLGSNKPAIPQLLANRASALEAQGRYEEAEPVRKRQLSLLDAARQPSEVQSDTPAGIARQQMGRLYRLWGRDEAAEQYFRQAVALLHSDPKANAELADCLNDLGRLYLDRKDYAKSESPLREALTIRRRLAGNLPPAKQADFAESLHNVGTLGLAARNYDKAEPFLREALTIREKAAPAGDLSTAATLHNLGTLHEAQKRYAQADGELKRALAITERALGADHIEVAAAVESLATLYGLMGNAAEAERHFRRALAIREKAYGTEHPSVAATQHNLANFYRDQKRYADAEPLYRHALVAKEKALGAEHASLAPLLDNYAQLLQQTNRASDAAKLTARAKAIKAKAPGKSNG
jgi:Tfp pilus assembly protein PilF